MQNYVRIGQFTPVGKDLAKVQARLTFDHPDSHFGMAVFVQRVDGRDRLMQYHDGVRWLLARCRIDRQELARKCGVCVSQVSHWTTGHRYPGAANLNVMMRLLKQRRRSSRAGKGQTATSPS